MQAVSGVLNRLCKYFDAETIREFKKSQNDHELCDVLMKAAELQNHENDLDFALETYESLPPLEYTPVPAPSTALVPLGRSRTVLEAVGILDYVQPVINRQGARERLAALVVPNVIPSGPVICLGDGMTTDQEGNMLADRLKWIASFMQKEEHEFLTDQFGNYIVVKQRPDGSKKHQHEIRPENLSHHLTLYRENGWVIV